MCVKTNRANRIIITRDNVVDIIWRAVCINNANNRNSKLAGFFYCDVFMTDIYNKHGGRQVLHVLDTTECFFELVALAGQLQDFFLYKACKAAVLFHFFNLAQALDGLTDGAEVGQHAAQPAV